MSGKSLKVITELLNEEKWTRATLNSYSIKNFKELDLLIEEIINDESQLEVTNLCDEHLTHTKNSIIALYISGIISLNRQLLDDSNLVILINIFSDNHKWNIVEYLCERILEFGENKLALRTLSECYDNENETEKKYQIWERLIKVDYNEADIVRHIAEKKEEEEDISKAVEYYKKAIHRFINKKSFAPVKEIWKKLLEYCPEDIDLFFHIDKKIEKTISSDRASQLLEELYRSYKGMEDWNTSIDILKRILGYEEKNVWARKEITECYRGKYCSHSQVDEYIRLSNLTQSWRNVYDAINDFEKHISFDVGNFVCHKSWGIGRINEIKNDEITVDFSRKRGHKMSLKMAVNALNSLSKDHIWVLRATTRKEELHDKVKKDISWALKTVIKSYKNAVSMKEIKAELVPNILSAGEWTSWSQAARKILKDDTSFGNLPDKLDRFVVRDKPISIEEKTFNKFKAEKDFFLRYLTMEDFIKISDPESEYFNEMFSYFTTFLKSYNNVNESVISSYILIKKIVKQFPFVNPGFDFAFLDLIQKIDDIAVLYTKIENNEVKQEFLIQLRKTKDWPDLFIKLFPKSMSRYIINELEEGGYIDKIKELFNSILDLYKEYREAFIWIVKSYNEETLRNKYDLDYEKIIIKLLHLLEITFREIESRRDTSLNRKINKQIQSFLFKDMNLEHFLLNTDKEAIIRVYTLINDVNDLDPSIKIELKHKIIAKYPDIIFYGEVEKEVISRGLLVTKESLERKKKKIKHIIDVEIPDNSKEIGAAIELGDLSENAEYKAGKERQEMLNISVGKLKEEIEKAQIFSKNQIDVSKISFGTEVVLLNKTTNNKEVYTFLGPWESEPLKNIISYLSPFGTELWNHKEKEELDFVINDNKYSYIIEKISESHLIG